MGSKLNVFQHLANMRDELLSRPRLSYPDDYIPPHVTGTRYDLGANISGTKPNRKCYTVLEIEAMNYADAARQAEGINVAGGTKEVVHVGRNLWEIRVTEFDN